LQLKNKNSAVIDSLTTVSLIDITLDLFCFLNYSHVYSNKQKHIRNFPLYVNSVQTEEYLPQPTQSWRKPDNPSRELTATGRPPSSPGGTILLWDVGGDGPTQRKPTACEVTQEVF